MAVDWTSGAGTGGLQRFDRAVSTCAAALLDNFVAERARWPLWSPVLLGCGIGSYFALSTEPPVWLGAAVLGIAVIIALLGRHSPPVLLLGLAAALAAGGFSAAQWRSARVAAPMLEKRFGPADVTGQVIRVESLPNGPRVLLGDVSLPGIAPGKTPRHVRIRLRRDDSVVVGDRIAVLAKLSPPSAPVAPGAYDFRRHLWFEGIGAIGDAYGTARKLVASENGRDSFSLWLAASRQTIADRIRAVVPGAPGAVTAALIVGDRSAIPEADNAAMRDSGLAHLLSISGLHMGLVASILFFGIRGLFALWERAALRWPIKKWAAAAAIMGSFAYLLVSGADVPAQRSFVMTGIVLLAVVLDRTAISLRLVAWAAMIVLLIAPESLLGPSFQMSFGAVVALVATYESWRSQAIRPGAHRPGRGISPGESSSICWRPSSPRSSPVPRRA